MSRFEFRLPTSAVDIPTLDHLIGCQRVPFEPATKIPANLDVRQIPVEPGNIREFFKGYGKYMLYRNDLWKKFDTITGNFFDLTGKRIGRTGN